LGTFSADTLRDSIESGWTLTGALAKTSTSTMKNPIKFFAHPQVKQIPTKKAIEVRKTTPLSADIIHQKFTEVRDVFEIKCRYTVEDVKNSKWDISEARVEDMCEEVNRIVKTVYDPNTGTGVYFVSNSGWTNNDDITSISQVLIRTMNLTLTRIKSEDTTVFKGYGGVLSFDTSESTGDSLPASDYTYTEAYDVQWTGGFKQLPELVDGTTSTDREPVWFTGGYSGRFNCTMQMKKADFTDSGTEQIKSIGNVLNSGEVADVTFLWAVTNTEGTAATLISSIPMRVISLEPTVDREDLSKFKLIGQITKPPTYSLS
jgi:hypothetical protein